MENQMDGWIYLIGLIFGILMMVVAVFIILVIKKPQLIKGTKYNKGYEKYRASTDVKDSKLLKSGLIILMLGIFTVYQMVAELLSSKSEFTFEGLLWIFIILLSPIAFKMGEDFAKRF